MRRPLPHDAPDILHPNESDPLRFCRFARADDGCRTALDRLRSEIMAIGHLARYGEKDLAGTDLAGVIGQAAYLLLIAISTDLFHLGEHQKFLEAHCRQPCRFKTRIPSSFQRPPGAGACFTT